ncbi:hypothetical protein [Hymenobacter lapidiphilus]|uniref:Uncharacterized protein n=1 Tax=Hymenobacter lapidiphilus TaxID=2608003 RepID=A0A7Y7PNR4_9BACT|nr:hypothetical protein [Hymenobacter lapidiphilus]NVO31194.1 hypothetical protein [Hymenobacter lapidiphilus]
MLDPLENADCKRAHYRRIKDEVMKCEEWLDEVSTARTFNIITNDLVDSLEADIKKWRQAIKLYVARP